MSLKAKIEAVIYASEEPVTLAQLASLLGEEAQSEMDAQRAKQEELALEANDSDSASDEPESESAEEIEAAEEAAVEESAGVGDQHEGEDAASDAVVSDAPVSEEAVSEEATELTAEEIAAAAEAEKKKQREQERAVREYLRAEADALIREYAEADRGIEVREVAGGYRMATKPEYHDAVRGFVKSLRPPMKLTLQALETLAVVAYKQPVTAAEISEIRSVDSAGVLGGLMTRKLIQTAGRKQVLGRPMLYKTTKEFLVRFGLKDLGELPSMEEFERMAGELAEQEDLPMERGEVSAMIEDANARGDAEMLREDEAAHVESVTAEASDVDAQAESAAESSVEETAAEDSSEISSGVIVSSEVPEEEIAAESTED